jgi:hypothetical protein
MDWEIEIRIVILKHSYTHTEQRKKTTSAYSKVWQWQ